MQSLIISGVIWLFRHVGKTRAMSTSCNITFGVVFESIQYFSELTTPNIIHNGRAY